MLESVSDSFLSSLNTALQWIAIAGTAAGLLSMVGLLFVNSEISRRQENRIEATDQRYRPRSITEEQKHTIIAALAQIERSKGVINILTCIHGDSDQYGRELWRVLNDAGVPLSYSLCLAEYPDGITINPKDDPTPSLAQPVIEALNMAGIKIPVYRAPKETGSDAGIDIMVGRKPTR